MPNAQSEAPKKPVLITDRVRQLEELTGGLAAFVQNEVPATKSAVANLVEVLNAIIEVNGGEEYTKKVQAVIDTKRAQRATEKNEREAKLVEKAVSDGVLVPVEAVTEKSFIVGREFNNEDKMLSARTQVDFTQFTDEAKKQVLGQGIGFVINGPDGKFEVTEIYEPGTPKAPEVTEAKAETVSAEAPKAE